MLCDSSRTNFGMIPFIGDVNDVVVYVGDDTNAECWCVGSKKIVDGLVAVLVAHEVVKLVVVVVVVVSSGLVKTKFV